MICEATPARVGARCYNPVEDISLQKQEQTDRDTIAREWMYAVCSTECCCTRELANA